MRAVQLVATLVVVWSIVALANTPIPWTDCGSNEHLHITQAEANIFPPIMGQNWEFWLSGNFDENVTGAGQYSITVYFDGYPIFGKSDSLASLNITRIPAGPFNEHQAFDFPKLPLGGDIKIHLELKDQDGGPLICAEISFNLQLSRPVTDHSAIQQINFMQRSWKAGENKYFHGWTLAEARRLLGVRPSTKRFPSRPRFSAHLIQQLPKQFDSRRTFAGCVGPVLDQGRCGSCWAFGAIEAISDRLCIQNGQFLQLAALDLVSCDAYDGGCNGGMLETAWDYAQYSGLVTEDCFPYLTTQGGPIPTCAPNQQPCLDFVNTPDCPAKCTNNETLSSSKHFVASVYSVSGVDQIAAEITQHGPLEASFTVFEDFLNYKSGVYQYTSGQELGGHAIKIVGYGTENNLDYWLCQNSWTTSWGDQGFFKIARGTDECGIEESVVAGTLQSRKQIK